MASPGGVAGDMGLKRAAIAQAHEGLAQHLPECDPAAAGKDVIGRDHKNELVGPERQRLQGAEVGRVGHDAEIGQAASDGENDLVAGTLFHVDVDQGMMGEEGCESIGQELGQGSSIREHSHVPRKPLAYCPSSPRICSSCPSTTRA